MYIKDVLSLPYLQQWKTGNNLTIGEWLTSYWQLRNGLYFKSFYSYKNVHNIIVSKNNMREKSQEGVHQDTEWWLLLVQLQVFLSLIYILLNVNNMKSILVCNMWFDTSYFLFFRGNSD